MINQKMLNLAAGHLDNFFYYTMDLLVLPLD